MADADLVEMFTGKLNSQQAFMQGKLKISGNMALATKLGNILKSTAAAPKSAAVSSSTASSSASSAPAASGSPSLTVPGFKAGEAFVQLQSGVNADAVKKVGGVYLFKVTGGEGGATAHWTVDLKNGAGSIKVGAVEKPDCTLTLSDSDLVEMFTGKLNSQQAFMQGKLKIAGNMGLATKLGNVIKSAGAPKAAASAGPTQSAAAAPAAEGTASSGAGGFKSAQVFALLEKKIDAEAVKKVGGVYHFKITGDGGAAASWTVDLKNGNGAVRSGAPEKADCTLSMNDADLVEMFSGKLNSQQAFMQGKLKISGNMALATKLGSVLNAAKAKL